MPFSVPHASADLRGDVLRLVKSAVIALKADVLSLSVLCPEAFCLPPPVIPDHFICRVQYILRRAVILLELNDLRIRKDLFKIQDIFDVGPAETINALVVVAYNAEVPVLFRQKAYKTELGRIGILILIHHDVFETLPIDLQDIRMLLKELDGLHDEIVKVHGVVLFEPFRIFFIEVGDKVPIEVSAGHFRVLIGRDQFIFCGGDHIQDPLFLEFLRVNAVALKDLLHDRELVIRIIDREITGIAQLLRMSAKDPDTAGMKGHDPDLAGTEPDHIIDTASHLIRGFVREGDRQDASRHDAERVNEVGDPVDQDSGLAGTGTGQNEDRAFRREDRFFLFIIEHLQNLICFHLLSPDLYNWNFPHETAKK